MGDRDRDGRARLDGRGQLAPRGRTGAATLLIAVEPAKKCFDFAFTTYFLHWAVTLFYSGFPSSWSWWVVTALCVVIMSVGGEQLCMKIELSEINLGGAGGFKDKRGRRAAAAAVQARTAAGRRGSRESRETELAYGASGLM